MKSIAIFSLLLPFSLNASAQSTYLSVGDAKVKKPVIAITGETSTITSTIQDDLDFVGLFRLLPKAGFPQKESLSASSIDYPEWLKVGTDYLILSELSTAEGKTDFKVKLMNVGLKKEVLAKKYSASLSSSKTLAHTAANDIYEAITGKKGIFLTKIAFVCDKTQKKEVYTMDFDGSDVKQITKLRSISMAPAWSPDGKKLAFSVYNRRKKDNQKNLDLFEYNFKNAKLRLLSNRKGINSGANYNPKGKTLALTMSYSGNPEIHVLKLRSRKTRRVTHSVGFDVDPAFSPDGEKIAFVSSRPGKPMLYVMNNTGGDVKRLTYAGRYNATPSWSPDGKKIAFAGWLDKGFDIFTITAQGGKIERLSKNEGNNEDPSYSPDGNFVIFSSNRRGNKDIWFMNEDGTNVKRLTHGMGHCVAPKWSPYLD